MLYFNELANNLADEKWYTKCKTNTADELRE